MTFYIYRNTTIENIFGMQNFIYSGYNNISSSDAQPDAFVWFYIVPIDSSNKLLVHEIGAYLQQIKFIHNQLPSNKLFYVFTLQNFNSLKFEQSDYSVENSIENFNSGLIQYASEHSNIKVIDIAEFTKAYAFDQLIDWKHYFISKTIINPRLSKSLKEWFFRQVDLIEHKRKKCLIIDLDNTIWGGVLGEDGVDGIKIGGDYPGSAYALFQQYLIELTHTGVILAVCSKNNEQDVLEAWDKNPFQKLKREHFATYLINWENKAENIKQIAAELNIGLDSLVFVDDNPAERQLVKSFLPEVEVPDFPSQPYDLPHFFASLLSDFFAIYSITDEDKAKTEHYSANAKRTSEIANFNDFSDYLASLQIQVEVQQANNFTVERITQMTQKTNQFNLTTKRYNDADIQNFSAEVNKVFCIKVSDKFGDSGITGAVILNYIDSKTVDIDTFLLSCRILGKEIEIAFINWLLDFLKSNQFEQVTASYIPTNKNMQVSHFWEKAGFQLTGTQNDTKKYKLELRNWSYSASSNHTVTYHEE